MPYHENNDSGVDQYYTLVGSGKIKVVMITGLSQIADEWIHIKKKFSESENYQCLLFDNRGKGRTKCPVGRITTSLMAQDTASLIDHLEWDEVHIVGYSLGGMIALEYAVLYPQKIQSLTLLSTTAGQFTDARNLMISPTVLQKFGWALLVNLWMTSEILMDINLSIKYGSATKTNTDKFAKAIEYEREISLLHMEPHNRDTLTGFLQQLGAVYTHHVCKRKLEHIKRQAFPVVVLTGTDDIMVRSINSKYLAKYLEAEFHELKGYGHDLHASCPEIVIDILLKTWNTPSRVYKGTATT